MDIQQLKKEEKRYFDTYKMCRTNDEKVKHLIEMSEIIKQISQYEKSKSRLEKESKKN